MDETEELTSELKKRFEDAGLAKKTWIPVTRDSDGALTASKFSGKPYLRKSESWPICKLCGDPLQLFIQIDLSELPVENRVINTGLLQFFFCKEYACWASNESFLEFPPHQFLRIVKPTTLNETVTEPEGHFPPKEITNWKYVGYEYPPYADEFTDIETSPVYIEDESDEYYMIDNYAQSMISGEKIGGYPYFIQDKREPECSICEKPLAIILQIGSRDNLPFMFGDGGVGHIFVCQKHKKNIYFIWDCC